MTLEEIEKVLAGTGITIWHPVNQARLILSISIAVTDLEIAQQPDLEALKELIFGRFCVQMGK